MSRSGMNVPAEKLTTWNRFAELARNTAIAARLAYAGGDRDKGKALLKTLEEAAAAASVSLEAAGAERPLALPVASTVPLNLLSTDASRRYARLMREAYEAARAVDHERGYGNDGPADLLEGLAEEAELNAYGAVGMVKE